MLHIFISLHSYFYGNNLYSLKPLNILDHLISRNCSVQHVTAPQLIQQWQELMYFCWCWRWVATCIYKCLLSVCSEAALDFCAVWQWIQWFKEAGRGGASLHDKLWIGCTCPEMMPHCITGDWCITTYELCSTLPLVKALYKGNYVSSRLLQVLCLCALNADRCSQRD